MASDPRIPTKWLFDHLNKYKKTGAREVSPGLHENPNYLIASLSLPIPLLSPPPRPPLWPCMLQGIADHIPLTNLCSLPVIDTVNSRGYAAPLHSATLQAWDQHRKDSSDT